MFETLFYSYTHRIKWNYHIDRYKFGSLLEWHCFMGIGNCFTVTCSLLHQIYSEWKETQKINVKNSFSRLFSMKGAFSFDRFNVISYKKLLPLPMLLIPVMTNIRMFRETIPLLNSFPYSFTGHDPTPLCSF